MARTLGLILTVTLLLVGNEGRQRVDLFDAEGHRTGYAIIDRGRVDLYDRNSRRTGYGRIDRGHIDLFDRDGRRTGRGRVDQYGVGTPKR